MILAVKTDFLLELEKERDFGENKSGMTGVKVL